MEQDSKKPSFVKRSLWWAAYMYLFNTGFTVLFQGEFTWKPIVLGVPFWLVGGMGLAYITEHFNKKIKKKA